MCGEDNFIILTIYRTSYKIGLKRNFIEVSDKLWTLEKRGNFEKLTIANGG